MTVERREQVFVSSTFKDLVEERAAVIQTLLEADCIPAGMEMFPASDSDKFDLIKRVIDLCDYYVVIIGGRYGTVDAGVNLSYTEMEYDYAVGTGKPVMAFLHGDPGKLIGEKLDLDADLRKKLETFRQKTERRMVKYWSDLGDLKGQVALAIIQIRKSHPVEGWIRASEAMTPEVKAELVELRAKVRELSADLKDEQRQRTAAVDPSELVQGDETAHIGCTLEFHWQSTIDTGKAYPSNRAHGSWTITPTWNRILRHLGPELMDESSEEYLMERLSALCLEASSDDLLKKDRNDRGTDDSDDPGNKDDSQEGPDAESDDDDQVGRIYEATVSIESFNDVKVQFAALGLIEKGAKRRPGSDRHTYWRLTERGHNQLLRLRAIRKPTLVTPGQADGGD
ncbi:DUF4062 domain-containing protein [Micromonospora taraxaci]|uniref:DUF4062 domain-containing protein n=1 Tax=Micromonospora taraxaci TaxID=1316803 RepID=UPI003C2B4906